MISSIIMISYDFVMIALVVVIAVESFGLVVAAFLLPARILALMMVPQTILVGTLRSCISHCVDHESSLLQLPDARCARLLVEVCKPWMLQASACPLAITMCSNRITTICRSLFPVSTCASCLVAKLGSPPGCSSDRSVSGLPSKV